MKCIVLAGGEGLRLWPLSRKKYPKQFLKISGNNTMFEDTILRNMEFSNSYMVLTNNEFRFIVEDQMEKMNINNYEMFLETIGRNTAPAIALACMKSHPNEILFVVPADAKIDIGENYTAAVRQAEKLAQVGNIVTFGINPSSPHTGYGYIKYKYNDVIAFKEKPSLDIAEEYLKEGDYLWNSGMFMFQASVFLEELKKYRSDIYHACYNLAKELPQENAVLLSRDQLEKIPAESIDYAVMERSDKIKVIPSSFGWNDVGGLEAICDQKKSDENGNSVDKNNSIIHQCENVSVINETEDQIVVVNGLKNAIVINTYDAVYISKYGNSSEIKKIIEENTQKYENFFNANIKNYRPWGFYEVLVNTVGYKVKRITIYPHKKISLQKHEYRSEHWTVVSGLATITLDKETNVYSANHSAYIPIGKYHRVGNDTDENIEIIEVSLGVKVDEEDIVIIKKDF